MNKKEGPVVKHKTNRRAELLSAARKVFAEKGYEATTISEIVTQASVAQGTFYLYFPSKVALVIALEEEVQQNIDTAIREAYLQATDPGQMIEVSVRAAFGILGEYRDILRVLHSGYCWTEAPQERIRVFAPYYALIADLIRYEQGRNLVAATLQPDITAVLIVGTIYYAADECYLYHPDSDPELYINAAVDFVRRALKAP